MPKCFKCYASFDWLQCVPYMLCPCQSWERVFLHLPRTCPLHLCSKLQSDHGSYYERTLTNRFILTFQEFDHLDYIFCKSSIIIFLNRYLAGEIFAKYFKCFTYIFFFFQLYSNSKVRSTLSLHTIKHLEIWQMRKLSCNVNLLQSCFQ